MLNSKFPSLLSPSYFFLSQKAIINVIMKSVILIYGLAHGRSNIHQVLQTLQNSLLEFPVEREKVCEFVLSCTKQLHMNV
jgi:hypothetical protein